MKANITSNSKIYAVIGENVENSLSPLIHNFLFDYYSLDAYYFPISIKYENRKNFITAYKTLGLSGVNITTPYKQSFLDEVLLMDVAKETKAINTLSYKDDNLVGNNTDIYGIEKSFQYDDIDFAEKNVLILGAGGSTKTLATFLQKTCVKKVIIYNRTYEKAKNIACEYDKRFEAIETIDECIENINIIINTTSVGYNSLECPISYEKVKLFTNVEYVFDLIYTPRCTTLLTLFSEQGVKTRNGLVMLVYQAVKSFQIWTGIEVSNECIEEVKKIVENKAYKHYDKTT